MRIDVKDFLRKGTVGLGLVSAAALGSPRLVTMSPAVTEIVYQLDRGGDLVGAAAMSDYPPEAKQLPSLGTIFGPSLERALRLAPNWIVEDASTPSPAFERGMRALRLRHFTFDVTSVPALLDESEAFLKTIYGEARTPGLEARRQCWASASAGEPFTFLAFAWLSPAFVFGRTSYLSNLISHLGGENALPEKWTMPYPQISEEWVIAHPVRVVYFLSQFPDEEEHARRQLAVWWPQQKVELIVLSPDTFARASFTPLEHASRLRKTAAARALESCFLEAARKGKTR